MKILFAASEGVPFCKTGGLADVVGALSEALAGRRHTVRVILPLYRQVRLNFTQIKPTGKMAIVPMEGKLESAEIWQADIRPGLTYYFVDAPAYFDRAGLYGELPGTSYPDNDRRYTFYARAVFEVAKAMNFQPDIIHGHDWQAGPAMAYLKLIYSKTPFFAKTSSVFTIHNLAYQGNFPPASFVATGLPASAYTVKTGEFYGHFSFLKTGLIYADALNTVSPTYAKEIRTDKNFGCGMEGILQDRVADFEGIVNGIDTHFWDPRNDANLAAPFDMKRLEGRLKCKADLQKAAGLNVSSAPLLAFIGRLDPQKGVDMLIDVVPAALRQGAQFISLGQGSSIYVKALRELEQRYPAQVHVKTDFAEPFAHKIYAGCDIFLMPSRYEPCGLGQLIAMRYGAVPVVTPTGGLLDTVTSETGFISGGMSSGDFLSTVLAAMKNLKDAANWRLMQERGMTRDFSWKKSVTDYLLLYESVARK